MQRFLLSSCYRPWFPGSPYRSCISDDSPLFVIMFLSTAIKCFCVSACIEDHSALLLIISAMATIHPVSISVAYGPFTRFAPGFSIGDDSAVFTGELASAKIRRSSFSLLYRRPLPPG
jgi:hypothetical protein